MKFRTLLFFLCFIAQLSCSDDGLDPNDFVDDASIQTLNGTWKVESFEDYETGQVEYQTQANSSGYDIVITFDDTKDPKVFGGQVTTNGVAGEFEYIGERGLDVLSYASTFINQPEWGDKFGAAFGDDDISFRINSQRLRILYDGRKKGVTLSKQ
jgi:hypothetical protein